MKYKACFIIVLNTKYATNPEVPQNLPCIPHSPILFKDILLISSPKFHLCRSVSQKRIYNHNTPLMPVTHATLTSCLWSLRLISLVSL